MEAKPSLNEPRTKIEWARGHLNAFNEATRLVIEAHHDLIISELDENIGKKVFRLRNIAIPIDLSLRIGDVLSNLRSTLDYLVWQLVLANGCTPDRRNEFPFYGDRKSFNEGRLGKLRGVCPTAQTIIEQLQPYNRGNWYLFALNTLRNEDAHRYLMLTIFRQTGGIYRGDDLSVADALEFSSFCFNGALEDDTVLMQLPSEHMDVDFIPTLDIGLRHRKHWGSASEILNEMLVKVEQTINKFHSFF